MNFIAFDLETHKIQPGLLTPPIVCGSSAWRLPDGSIANNLIEKNDVLAAAKAFLIGQETICGANIAYDFGCISAADPSLIPLIFDKYARGQVWDTSIALALHLVALGCMRDGELFDPRTGNKLIDPTSGKITNRVSLAVSVDVALQRRDAKLNDRFRTSYALLENIPVAQWPEDAVQYPKDDARNTLEVAEWEFVNCQNQCDLAAQCETAWVLQLSSAWGVRTNATRVEALEAALKRQRDLDVSFAMSRGFIRADGSKDTKAIQARVSQAYNGTPPLTETGRVSTSKLVLEESGDSDLEQFANVAGVEAQLTRYLPVLQAAAKAPLNQRCNILIANGRVSYDGIIQTMPREGPIRECFESLPGYSWCSVDWAAVEMSTLAQVQIWTVGQSKLADALNGGLDPHSLLGSQLMSMSYEDFKKAVSAGDKYLSGIRQAAKAANFGFPGMMGAFKFVLAKRKEGLKICQLMRTAETCGEEKITQWKGHDYSPACKACVLAAEKLRNSYLHEMWTDMPAYFNWVTSHLDEADRLTQFVSNRVRGGLHAPAAANTLFSGLAADMAKSAVRQITRECYLGEGPLLGSRLVLFTHDETMLEIPDAKLTEAAHRQAELMCAQKEKYCPDVVVKAEPAAMKVWYKKARPVYEDGKLVPWEPKHDC